MTLTRLPKWRLVSKVGNPLYDWPLSLSLDSAKYGFDANTESSVSITMRKSCATTDCDMYYSVLFGNDKYISLHTGYTGIAIYPPCNSPTIATGDPTDVLSSIPTSITNPMQQQNKLRTSLADGNQSKWDIMTKRAVDPNLPITLQFINNASDDTFTFRFASEDFKRGIECEYGAAMQTGMEIEVFLTNSWVTSADGSQVALIRSFLHNGYV